ncbi:DnaD domain-containing protein [Carnobacterium pleistocenium]|uniref:DnaD domain-containing protein n=1 Tax=Carnobacterium pleistocenium TaxID=181073 RepID=UPI0006925737|nr:DnaD domain protein [Carnobacterium pleistocenium]
MAIYRQIQISFWQDELIIELDPEEKYFYLYLMTNDKTTQCGIYRINKKIVAFDTGWSIEKVDLMLNKFINHGRIEYNDKNKEIFLKNWLKFNKGTSPKVATVIDRELVNVKTTKFLNEVVEQCKSYKYPIKTKNIEYPYSIDSGSEIENTVPIGVGNKNQNQNQNQNNNQNQNKTENDDVVPAGPNAHEFYQNNFGVENSITSQNIEYWIDDLSEELVIEAMKRAALDQKGYRYAEGIMKNWAKKDIKNMDQVKSADVSFENSKNKSSYGNQSTRKETLPDWAAEDSQPVKETPMSDEEKAAFTERLKKIQNFDKEKESKIEDTLHGFKVGH